ncbi:high affinity cAMP-specific and IBMX-insensitive 3',5'-cyclic phosphodiesterase 8A-like [Myotis daubentonii]|uniref:high affinity cAMP-specific and IBMX-insensitive 3',5'-cyclic phosphodiesterase 8A-like n=1 Tax=Myotis daubentonii TaxID=98922 RepID=UPI002872D31E|nr:high affinity cAMP-specific and IBMX-insensitive 3',5'-cyclic phosphodiesterase 8A-like [Myotis daubentonii]
MGCAPSVHISSEAPGAYLGGKEEEDAQNPWALLQGATLPSDPYLPRGKIPTSEVQFGPMRFHPDQLQVLLAFSKDDNQCKAFRQACDQAGFKCTLTKEMQAVLTCFLSAHHDIVILDHRNPRQLDARALCRAIRSSQVSENTVIVGVVRRRDGELPVMPLLTAGFTRRYVEDPSPLACYTELLQLQFGEVRSQLKLRACNSIFTALEKSQDAVEITGQDHLVQYVNPAFETTVGCDSHELVGKELAKLPVGEKKSELFQTINSCITEGKEWQGVYCAKNGDNTQQNVKVIPVSGQGGKIRHYVSIIQLSNGKSKAGLQADSLTDSQVGKLKDRRLSSRASEMAGQRRHSSLARIQPVAMEAPITKVINIISAAQENSSVPVTEALDRALEILRTTELYSPQFGAKDEDPHANDLLGGLIVNGLRRLSGNEYTLSAKNLPRASSSMTAPLPLQDVPKQIAEALENEDSWEFDIFELEAATQKRALSYLAIKIFSRFGICEFLKCPEPTLRLWLQMIESTYHSSNPYHNSSHAADVLQATCYFLCQERIKRALDSVDQAAALIAAAVHDLDHPGRTNPFLCNSGSELAILYNDFAVLESHHASLAFQLTLRDDKSNIFKNMERSDFRTLRQAIIDMVLATEMTKHFVHLNKFVNSVVKPLAELEEREETDAVRADINTMLRTPENRTMIKRMMIKCADVSNPCRPLEQCIKWASRISEEYFSQTDEEKRRNLPVVMPAFDRNTCSIPKAQMSFINYFIIDMFDAWDSFVDLPVLVHHLDNNFRYWKELDEMNVRGFRPPPV